MQVKEQENQLVLNLTVDIILTVLVWSGSLIFVGYQLWSLFVKKEVPVTIGFNIPTVKQANLEVLRSSIKATSGSNLPVVRTEPFD